MSQVVAKVPSGEGLMFQHFLPCRFKEINERALRSLYGTRECLGISHPEFYIMVVLSEHILSEDTEISSRDISKITAMDKATITRALDRLADKGLISRVKGKKDSRLVKLSLTNEGKRVYAEIEENTLAWERHYLKGISVREMNTLHTVLNKLSDNLEQMENE